MIITDHAEHRQKQRSIPQAAVDYILKHGKACRKRDAVHYFLTSAHLVGLPSHHEAHRYYGIRVVASKDRRVIITAYWEKNRRCRKPGLGSTYKDFYWEEDEAC